eukprot:CAMPEP_0196599160 /NCGR_PEP_ID=MMETSP1081-20130531/94711_1 /TAXON_ID=36882 /ORGANISM="Pyramimonas amylifera, Strain CCMP720" /LENGTH=516 /DNA_ID=CAMNT_0041924915 /DNA_START=707 /DNA_END=2257 /DNA_ORIENTATION=+
MVQDTTLALVSPDGNTAYVGEAYKNRILSIGLNNGLVTYLAGGTRGLQDGPASEAKFSWPYGVALSPDSATLYVADSGNDCIRALSLASGIVITIAGGGAGSRGFHDGSAESARFAWPYGVAVSPDGRTVYVADSGNNRIRTIDVLSGTVSTIAGAGNAGYQDGPALKSRFYGPRGVAATPDGAYLYIADYSNFRVRALRLADHTVSTVFGGGVEIYRPAGVAVTADGSYVFAADSANGKIRGVRVNRRKEVSKSSLDRRSNVNIEWPSDPLERIELDEDRIGMDEELLVPISTNWTIVEDLGAPPLPQRSRRKGDFWNHEATEEMGIDELHLKHAITAVILFLVLALLGAIGIVAGALWQRRNALLMLQHYQSSASQYQSQQHYNSQTPHSQPQHSHFSDRLQHHPEKHEYSLSMSPVVDNEDNASNSSTNSNIKVGVSLDQPQIVHLRDCVAQSQAYINLTHQTPSVIRRATSSVWPENLENRPMQHQRSTKDLRTVFRRSNSPSPMDTDVQCG